MGDLRTVSGEMTGLAINQNSVELSRNAKGEPSYCVKIYFGEGIEEKDRAQARVQEFDLWFFSNFKTK